MPYITLRETDIFYEQSDKSNRNLPVAIFIHGARGSVKRWRSQFGNLQYVCRILLIDLPGHGQSGGVPLSTVEDMTTLIREFADALNIPKFILVGHSMGGAVATDFAAKHPDRLLGLVLIDTAVRFSIAPETIKLLAQGIKPFQHIDRSFSSSVPAELLKEAEEELEAISTEAYLSDLTACSRYDGTELLKLIKNPTLVLCGNEDRITPVEKALFLKEHISNSRLVVIQGAGHLPMLEQPATVNKELEWFFRAIPII